jgi:hypothetical protein
MTLGRQLTIAELAFDSSGLRQMRARVAKEFLQIARDSVADAGRRVEKDLEAAYEQAGLGKLARAWNSKVYPKTGLAEAPTVDVRGKGKERTRGALAGYATGGQARGKSGQYLAIPLRAAGRRFTGRGKVALTPQEWQRRTGLRLEPARIGGKLYLVTKGVRSKKTGLVARKATLRRLEQGRAVERLLVFLLLDEVTIQKRVSVEPIFARGPAYLDEIFTRRVNGFIAFAGQGGRPGQ